MLIISPLSLRVFKFLKHATVFRCANSFSRTAAAGTDKKLSKLSIGTLRDGFKKKKKLMEFSFKLAGWVLDDPVFHYIYVLKMLYFA